MGDLLAAVRLGTRTAVDLQKTKDTMYGYKHVVRITPDGQGSFSISQFYICMAEPSAYPV